MAINTSLIAKADIIINAETERVWETLTNPELIKQYFFGTNVVSDWKKGSEIVFHGEYQEQRYRDKGIIIESRVAEFLQYTYWSSFSGLEDIPENYSLVEYKLVPEQGTTLLTLTQTGFANEQAQGHTQNAWEKVLLKIKELTEGQ